VVLVVAHLTVASLGTWRGVTRGRAVAVWDTGSGLGIALTLPVAVGVIALAGGSWGSFVGAMAVALPLHPVATFFRDALVVTTALLVLDGVQTRVSSPSRWLWTGLAIAALFLAVVRVARVASLVTLPLEVSWSEAPALVNALKLDAHQPLYGPAREARLARAEAREAVSIDGYRGALVFRRIECELSTQTKRRRAP
jgi:hypothetical protein